MTDHQLPVADAELVACAARVRANAYARNSHFPVGAALLTGRGAVIEGASVENAAIGSTICAERSAICRAISEGHRDFIAGAIVADAEAILLPLRRWPPVSRGVQPPDAGADEQSAQRDHRTELGGAAPVSLRAELRGSGPDVGRSALLRARGSRETP